MSKILCFMDFEYTTSGDKRSDFKEDKIELLSIGAIFIDSETRKEVNKFYEVVKPKKNTVLSEYCTELTKLSQEEVDAARSMEMVVGEFVDIASQYSDIEYYIWGNFDYIALKRSIKINKYKGGFRKVVNSLKNIQPRVSKSIQYKKEVLKTEWGLQGVRLVYGMEESENKHNALSDAKDLMEVYYAFKDKAPKNKEILKEVYEKKLSDKNRVIEKGLSKHSKEINDLWSKIDKSNKHHIQNTNRSHLRMLDNNIDIEYRGIESIAYHSKTVSLVKKKSTKSNTIGVKVEGKPLAHSVQYKYSDLQVEIYPKVRRDESSNLDIPVIEVRVYSEEKRLYSMWIDVKKSTRKSIIKFIKETFL